MADETTAEVATSRTITIAGMEFVASLPFAAGHVLTDIEAKVLNQTRTENLRNNFASRVKDHNDGKEGALTAEQLVAAFAEFDSKYEFSAASAGGGAKTLDPVEREAYKLAKEFLRVKLADKGQSLTPPKEADDAAKTAYKEQIASKIAEIAARPAFVAEAKKIVDQQSKRLEKLGADIEL